MKTDKGRMRAGAWLAPVVTVLLAACGGGDDAPPTAGATAAGALRFESAYFNAGEADGSATITVSRSGGSAGSVAVRYSTADGSASAGNDYFAAAGILNFAPGETRKTFTIELRDDNGYEGTESVLLSLAAPTGGATLDTPASALLSIVENEPVEAAISMPRPANDTCVAGTRQVASDVRLVRAFADLDFGQPVAMLPSPDGSKLFVLEKAGRVLAFDNDGNAASLMTAFDQRDQLIDSRSEGGLLGMAFDPGFAQNGYVYLYYTTSDAPAQNNGANFRSVVARFDTAADATTIVPANPLILLSIAQPYGNHNGGNIAFGADDMLYIGLGDGGSGGDPHDHGQRRDTLLGAMLRIDVSAPDADSGANYRIPDDNPFAGPASCAQGVCPAACQGAACAEIFAWGLRNPWRWSFDSATGALWLGDVGQRAREEVDLVESGRNYGWRCYEGNQPYDLSGCDAPPYTAPKTDYDRDLGVSITGGFVYRGTAVPELTGNYIFGDFGSGRIWALQDPYSASPARRELANTAHNISAFAQDADGELYLLSFSEGAIYRIARGAAQGTPGFATLLSQTGCADAGNPQLAAPGMIPYDINSPLWSDNAAKQRWLAIPDGAHISAGIDGDWDFPVGSVLRKDFLLGGTLVETRLLARHSDGGWAGYSYEWNAAGTEATLLGARAERDVAGQRWTFPGPDECLACHTSAAGRTLGPETAQMNRDFGYGTETANQILVFEGWGLFEALLPDRPYRLQALADPAGNEAVAGRARAYLHANCSHCHRPGGTGRGDTDLRQVVSLFDTLPLADTGLCNTPPEHGDLGDGANRLLLPGDPDRSLLLARMESTDPQLRMPRLGSAAVDMAGTSLMRQWIDLLGPCP